MPGIGPEARGVPGPPSVTAQRLPPGSSLRLRRDPPHGQQEGPEAGGLTAARARIRFETHFILSRLETLRISTLPAPIWVGQGPRGITAALGASPGTQWPRRGRASRLGPAAAASQLFLEARCASSRPASLGFCRSFLLLTVLGASDVSQILPLPVEGARVRCDPLRPGELSESKRGLALTSTPWEDTGHIHLQLFIQISCSR